MNARINYLVKLVITVLLIILFATYLMMVTSAGSDAKYSSDISANDYFGGAVDLYGDTAIVTSLNAIVQMAGGVQEFNKAGAGYIFAKTGGVWKEKAKLFANDAAENENLGFSASIDSNMVALGAWRATHGDTKNAGAVYMFGQQNGDWSQAQKIISELPQQNAQFGVSVDVHGDWLIVGEQRWNYEELENVGAASIYRRQNDSWELHQRLSPTTSQNNTFYGRSVSIYGDWAIVGAPSNISKDELSVGTAYIYKLSISGDWELTQHLADYNLTDNLYGGVVSVEGNVIAVGAWNDDTNGNNSGGVFVYKLKDGKWEFDDALFPESTMPNDKFGISLSISGNQILVGAHLKDNGSSADQGVAYLFERAAGQWSQIREYVPDSSENEIHYGRGVALDGENVLIGAEFSSHKGTKAGAVYFP